MANGCDVTKVTVSAELLRENIDKYIAYLSIDLDAAEREHCEWEGYVGTSTYLTKEQVVELRDKLTEILGET